MFLNFTKFDHRRIRRLWNCEVLCRAKGWTNREQQLADECPAGLNAGADCSIWNADSHLSIFFACRVSSSLPFGPTPFFYLTACGFKKRSRFRESDWVSQSLFSLFVFSSFLGNSRGSKNEYVHFQSPNGNCVFTKLILHFHFMHLLHLCFLVSTSSPLPRASMVSISINVLLYRRKTIFFYTTPKMYPSVFRGTDCSQAISLRSSRSTKSWKISNQRTIII